MQKRCDFLTESIEYLSYAVRPSHSEIVSHTMDVNKGIKALRNFTELKSFLGVYSVFRWAVPNFAGIASPLNNKLRKDHLFNFELNEKHLEAIKTF